MELTEIAVLIMAITLCILVLTLIPAILAFKRAAASFGALSEMVRCELKPTLQELTGVLAQIHRFEPLAA